MSQLTVKLSGDIALKRQLAALSLPAKKRAQFHRKIGREVQKQSKRRIKEQRDVNGHGFTPRRKGQQKVLRRLMRGKRGEQTKVYAGARKGTVTWPNPLTGKIARAQQEGINETITAKDMERRHGKPDYDAPASAEQAKALIEAGYRLGNGKYKTGKKKGQSKSRRVSQKWIRENLTLGQAGLILKIMRLTRSKDSWQIDLPSRAFFGLSKAEYLDIANGLIDETIKSVRRDARQRK